MGNRYAEGTSVTEEASKAELERVLRRYGASGYGYLWNQESRCVMVAFRVRHRSYRFEVPMPQPTDHEITHDRRGYALTQAQVDRRYEQESRRRWRVVVLGIKAKLEIATIGEGDFTFEREFLSWAMLADGRTLGEAADDEDGLLLPSGRLLLEAPA